jgi:ribosome assembly protein 4
MTTVLPPPSKRQKLATEIRSREQQELDIIPANAGSVKIQFVASQGNPSVDGPVMVPAADANPKNLELLLNALRGRVSVPTMYYVAQLTMPFVGLFRINSI